MGRRAGRCGYSHRRETPCLLSIAPGIAKAERGRGTPLARAADVHVVALRAGGREGAARAK